MNQRSNDLSNVHRKLKDLGIASEGHIVNRPAIESHETVPNIASTDIEVRADELVASHNGNNIQRDGITFRGQLELLEKVLVDVVSELKYHRQQLTIISAEKDTSGAVIQMGIA